MCASVLACLFLASQARAQQAPIETRLPPTTHTYIHWRGLKSLDAAKTKNGLLRLWNDPDFAPVRRAITSEAYGRMWRVPSTGKLTPDQLNSLIPLFENEAVFGEIASPAAKAGATAPNGFFIYDATGNTEVLRNAIELLRKSAPNSTKSSTYMFGDAKVDSVETPTETYFATQVGNYYVRASRKDVEEDLITRFRAKTATPSSLANEADWRRAKQDFAPGAIVEVFSRISKPSPGGLAKANDFNFSAFASGVHLERAHAWTASLSLAGEATRLRFAILGDTSAGSVFDVVGASSSVFETLPLARDGSSYSVSKLNLPAIYRILHGPILEALPQRQAGSLKGFDMLGSTMLGMPVPDALALFGGEIATISSTPGDPTYTDLYAATIREPAAVVSVVRKAVGSMIQNESRSGQTTFLDLAAAYTDPQTKATLQHFYYIGVTPHVLLFSPRRTMVRDAAARLSGAGGGTLGVTLASNPDFQHARALLPKSLTGFTYAQMTKQTWERELSVLARTAGKAAAGSDKTGASSGDVLQGVNLSVFARYLHSFASGWWKTPDGIYFDSYLQ